MIILNNPSEAANWLNNIVTGELRIDSREIQAGDGFIAWPGAAVDGRQFVKTAFQKGALACLVESNELDVKGYLKEYNCLASNDKIAIYKDLKFAIGNIAAQVYNTPAKLINIIAITGTNGKTTSAWWLAQALSSISNNTDNALSIKSKCFMVGTLGVGEPNTIEKVIEGTGLTTPDPIMLHKKFREYVDNGFTYCAIEASSIGIEEHRLDGTDIKVAVFTNFTQDHLDYHGSMQAYWEAKLKLFKWSNLKAAVINIDDPKGIVLLNILKNSNLDIWTIAINQPASITANNIENGKEGLQFNVAEGSESYLLKTKFFGQYNVSNILGVIAALRANGFALRDCLQACGALTAVPGRMDVLSKENQALVIVDYAHTPDALKQALIALRPVADNRSGQLICIFGCGGNRDVTKRPLMASMAEMYADKVIVTSDNSRYEKVGSILDHIISGFKSDEKYSIEANRAIAIANSIKTAQPNDVILIAGKGHESYQDEMGVKSYFSDKEHAWKAMTTSEVAA